MQCGNRIAARKAAIRFGIALHLGEVYYGNIGAPGRLDFTVIGPAVNQASRLEKLSAELGRNIVTSASFAAATPQHLESLAFINCAALLNRKSCSRRRSNGYR